MNFRSLLNRRSIAGWMVIPAAAVSGLITSTSVLASLPKDQSGLFFLCQAMMPFLLLFDMGLLVIGTREIAFASGRERNTIMLDGSGDVIQTFLMFRDARLVTIMMVAFSAILALLGSWLLPIGQPNANLQAILLCAVASTIVLSTYAYQGFLEGTGNYHLDRIASTISTLTTGLTVAAAAYWGRTFWWVLAAWYFGQSLTLILKAVLGHRINPEIHQTWRPARRRAEMAFKQSFSVFVIQVGAALTKFIQYPIITQVLGVAVLGSYFFVTRISSTIDQAISVLNASQRAVFSQLLAAGRARDARRLMLNVLGQVTILSALGGAVVVFVLPEAIGLILHRTGFDDVPFWVIGLDLVSMVTSGMMTQFVIASGRNPFPKAVIAAGIITILLLLILVPRFGLLGAALAQLLATASTNLWFSGLEFSRLSRNLAAEAQALPEPAKSSENV